MAGTDTIYWGAYIKGDAPSTITSYDSGGTINTGVTSFEANAGRVMSCIRIGGNPGKWGNGSATGSVPNTTPFSTMQAAVDPIIAHGSLPVADWAPWDWALPSSNYAFRLQAINVGTWDSYLTTWFTAAASWGKPLLLRVFWEENWYNQFPWQYHDAAGSWNIGTANGWGGATSWTNFRSDFISAHQRIVGIAQTTGAREGYGTGHIQFVWAPNRQASGDNPFSALTPGDAYIDWYGWDSYPDTPANTITDASRATGAMTYLRDIYGEMAALHPSKPMLIAETAWIGAQGSAVTPTSITSTTSAWTIVVPATPAPGGNGWAATNGIKLTGVTPSAYNGQFTIASVSGTGPWTLTVNQTNNPGTATALGSAQLIDDIARDAAISYDLETGFPVSMPRVRGFTLFYDGGWAPIYDFSSDDANARQSRSWSSFAKHLNSHYLAGGQMQNIGSRLWLPFQDQPMVDAGFERYLAVLRSTPGVKLLLANNDAAAATSIADSSGLGRNGTLNGTVNRGVAGSIPAQPNWTSISFPGAFGNFVSVADNADFSPNTTSKPLSWEFSVYFPVGSTATSFAIISKYGAAGAREWIMGMYSGNPGPAFDTYDGTNLITGFNTLTWPTAGAWHHWIVSYDPSLATNRWTVRPDGGATLTGGGTPTANTVPDTATTLAIGQNQDSTMQWAVPAGYQYGPIAIYSGVLTDETAAEHHNAWIASPAISALSGGTPTGTGTTSTWTTDIGGSTWLEYGLTTSYGTVTPLDQARLTSHSVTLTGLTAGTTYHYRAHSRNAAGTETVSADSTFTTVGTTQTILYVMVV